MKHENTVRTPSLANSRINTDSSANLSIGDTLRKAKKNLFFSRCLMGIMAVLILTALFVAFFTGYANPFLDYVNNAVG
ncbi:MAG: hypothetical protein E7386_10640 [Ruminococcaceae bacterium]|nr:hypothetical protein [Oscillospiraceae bacterium]